MWITYQLLGKMKVSKTFFSKPPFFIPNTSGKCGYPQITRELHTYDERFLATNVLTRSQTESWYNYWLSKNGERGTIIFDFGCTITFAAVEVVNTHNGKARDRSTRKFK